MKENVATLHTHTHTHTDTLEKRRIAWIDIAKCLGIFCIVMQHVKNRGLVRDIMTYCVPVFFFLAGLTFEKKASQKEFVKNKIKKLYIPYLITSIISICIYLLMGRFIGENIGFNLKDISINIFGMIYANADLGNMMWNRPLWFIPTLMIALIIMNCIEQIKNGKIRGITTIILTAVGMILSYFKINLPFQLETALSMLIWIYLGICLKSILLKIESNKKILTMLVIISLCIGISIGIINGPLSIIVDFYGKNIVLYFIAAFAWSMAITTISMKISTNKTLEFVGRNTMIILLIHKFPILFFQKICPIIKDLLENNNYLLQLSITILVSIASIYLCLLFDNYCIKK